MTLLVLDLTCDIIYNCVFATGACTPWGHLQGVSARGEWGGGDNEGWFDSKILNHITLSPDTYATENKIYMNCKDEDKTWGQTALALIRTTLPYLWPESLGCTVSRGSHHQEIADFELCEARSYLNHVCLGWWGMHLCVCLCTL